MPEPVGANLDSWLAPSRRAAGAAAAARLAAEGRQLPLTTALEYALANEPEEACLYLLGPARLFSGAQR